MVTPLTPQICWSFLIVVWVGARLIRRFAMPVAGPLVCRLLLVSYGLRVAVAFAFFVISYWRLPILASLHELPGFWQFAPDARVYHMCGAPLVSVWLHGTAMPYITGLGVEYLVVVAAAYTFFGSHPLLATVVNCFLGTLSGLLAFAISRRLSGERPAVVSAGLVAFWPSALIWSSQLLKDSLSLFLMLAVLLLIVQACAVLRTPGRIGIWRVTGWCLALISSVMFLTRLRFYLGSVLVVTVLVVLLPAAGAAVVNPALLRKGWVKRRLSLGVGYLLLATMVVVSVLFARGLDTARLLQSVQPAPRHFRLGMQAWNAGQSAEAAREFRQALAGDPSEGKVYLALAAVHLQAKQFDEALHVYEECLARARDGARLQANVRHLMEELHVMRGDAALKEGNWIKAQEAYEAARGLGVASHTLFERLALALEGQGKLNPAMTWAQQALEVAATPDERERIHQMLGRFATAQGSRLLEQGQYPQAQAAFEEVLRWVAPSASLFEQLAVALAGQGQFEAAIARANEALVMAWEDPDAVERVRGTRETLLAAQPNTSGEQGTAESAIVTAEETPAMAPVYLPARSEASAQPALLAPAKIAAVASHVAVLGVEALNGRLENQAVALLSESQSGVGASALEGRGGTVVVVDSFRQFDEHAVSTVQEATPKALGGRRQGFIARGGYSLMDPRAMIAHPDQLLRYLPRALAIGLLAPFPWQWFDTKGSTGIMRLYSGVEMLLLYVLLPVMWVGARRLVASRRTEAYVMLAWVVLTAVPLSLVVANMGTLFRLRLAFIFPLLVVAAEGRPVDMGSRVLATWGWFRAARAASRSAALSPGAPVPQENVEAAAS